MIRRKFLGAIGCLIASAVGTCFALAERTQYMWPGRYSEWALRRHLQGEKHDFDDDELEGLTFQDCIDIHDYHHNHYLNNNAPHGAGKGKQIKPNIGRGPTTIDDVGAWIKRSKTPEVKRAPAPVNKPAPVQRTETRSNAPAPAPDKEPKHPASRAPDVEPVRETIYLVPKPNPKTWQTTPKAQSEKDSRFRKLYLRFIGKFTR